MKSTLLFGALVLYASEVALAADCVQTALAVIPSCAQNCFINGAPSVGCGGTDFACQCNQEAALYAAIEGCVQSGCPSASWQNVIDGASTVCNCAVGEATAGGDSGPGTGGSASGTAAPTGSGGVGSTPAATTTTAPATTAYIGGYTNPLPTVSPFATAVSSTNRQASVELGVVVAIALASFAAAVAL